MATQTQVLDIINLYTNEYRLGPPQESRAEFIFLYKDESAGVAGPTEKEKNAMNELMGLLDFAGLVIEEEMKHNIVDEIQQDVFRSIEDLIVDGCEGDNTVSKYAAEVLANLESRLKKVNKVVKLDMHCMPYIADASGGKPNGKNVTGSRANAQIKPPNDKPALTLEDLAKGRFLRFVEEVQRGQEARGYHPTVKTITPWIWAQFCAVIGPHSSDKSKEMMSGIDIPDGSMAELMKKCRKILDTPEVCDAFIRFLDPEGKGESHRQQLRREKGLQEKARREKDRQGFWSRGVKSLFGAKK